MRFEIKRIINFEAGELASTALNVVDDYLSEYEPNYGELDDEQRNLLLKAIFSRAFEILEKED